MDLDDLNWQNKPYATMKAYQYSKLANILFANELSRKLKGEFMLTALFKILFFTVPLSNEIL